MNRITKIAVRGFRRLRRVDLELRPLTVVIGANGCGKTSLLEAFALLAASANRGLNQFLSEAGGLSNVLTLDKTSQLSFEVSLDIAGKSHYDYNVALGAKAHSYEVVSEELQQAQYSTGTPIIVFRKVAGQLELLNPSIGKRASSDGLPRLRKPRLAFLTTRPNCPQCFVNTSHRVVPIGRSALPATRQSEYRSNFAQRPRPGKMARISFHACISSANRTATALRRSKIQSEPHFPRFKASSYFPLQQA